MEGTVGKEGEGQYDSKARAARSGQAVDDWSGHRPCLSEFQDSWRPLEQFETKSH